jgi:hypothetical protein
MSHQPHHSAAGRVRARWGQAGVRGATGNDWLASTEIQRASRAPRPPRRGRQRAVLQPGARRSIAGARETAYKRAAYMAGAGPSSSSSERARPRRQGRPKPPVLVQTERPRVGAGQPAGTRDLRAARRQGLPTHIEQAQGSHQRMPNTQRRHHHHARQYAGMACRPAPPSMSRRLQQQRFAAGIC